MNVTFIMSFAGPDRASLLVDLAKFTHDNDGIWLNSKVSYLDGHVAANIKVSLPEDKAPMVKANLLAYKDLAVKIDNVSTSYATPSKSITVTIKANDRPGLVSEITHLIQESAAEILHIESRRLQVQPIGGTVFHSELVLKIPEDFNTDVLFSELKTIDESLLIN